MPDQPPRHSVSVAAVVLDGNGHALVIQRRDNGAWQLPGGVLELDETPEAGACREVFEETGLHIETGRLTGVYKNLTRGVVALVFRGHVISGSPHPTDESTAVEWWSAERVRSEMDETFAVRILDAMRDDTTPAVRSHDGIRLITG